MKSDNPYPDALVAIRGYRERLTPAGFKVIEIDFTADPNKDSSAWLDEQRRLLGDSMVRREVLRDWTVAAGDAFYPEYANYGGKVRYSFIAKGILRGVPVLRGWDLGSRHPVCIWAQQSPKTNKPYILKGLCSLKDVDTYTLLDLVLLYSGQTTEEEMIPSARGLYLSLCSDGLPRAPWFPAGVEFIDYSGPEAFTKSALAKPDDPRSAYEILASKGVVLQAPRMLIVDRVKVMRKLLHVDKLGRPGLYINDDPTTEEIHNMFNGGLSFPKGTKDNPIPSQPRKDGFYDDVNDAASYLLYQVCPLVDPPARMTRVRAGGETGRMLTRSVVDPEGEDSLGFYETRQRG